MKKRLIPIVLSCPWWDWEACPLCPYTISREMQVVNYTGVVRGATQRLVKEELKGRADDALIARLDGIMEELATGVGENRLIRLNDQPTRSCWHPWRTSGRCLRKKSCW